MIQHEQSFRAARLARWLGGRSEIQLELHVEHMAPVDVEVLDALGLEPTRRFALEERSQLQLRTRGLWIITLRSTGCWDLRLQLDASRVDGAGRKVLEGLELHAHLRMKQMSAEPAQELLCGTVMGTGLYWTLSTRALNGVGQPMILPGG